MPNETHKSSQSRLTDMPNQARRYAKSGSQICKIRLTDMPNQARRYAKSGSQISQIRLANMPNQAQDYAKSGSQICQIRLKNKPNQAHMPHKCAKPGIQGQIRLKSGDHYQTHWKENPVILSTPVSDKGIGHTYNEEKQTRGQNAEAERSIIGCETVKIRARTPFGFNDSKHIGINWRIILVNETAQKISLPVERSRNPLRFQGNTMRKQT